MDQDLLIQKFLHNQLSEEQRQAFEQLIDENPDFAQEVECCIILHAKYKAEFKLQLKKQLRISVEDKLLDFVKQSSTSTTSNIQKKATRILEFCDNALNKIHHASLIVRSSSQPTDFDKATLAFKQENYQKVIDILEKTTSKLPNKNEAKFYLGLSYLYLNTPNFVMAALYLEEILASQQLPYKEEAQWYLSLTYLKMGQIKEAYQQLNEIFQNQAWQHQEAQNLLAHFY